MTINFGPQCTCGQPQWTTAPYPCPVHGYYRTYYPPNTTFSTYRVCRGRHCAHDAQCNKTYISNGA